METSLLHRVFITISLFFFCFHLQAQSLLSGLEVGGFGGAAVYTGDLTPAQAGSVKTPGRSLGIYALKEVSHFISIRAQFAHNVVRASDANYSDPAWRQHRNFSFRTPMYELSALAVWNIRGNDNVQATRLLSPYLVGGLGASALRVSRDWTGFQSEYFATEANTLAGLAADQQHATPKIILVIPVGAGLKYGLSPKISVFAEGLYRRTFTDYLDGFSKAANPNKKDHYYTISLGLGYRFGTKNSLACPVVKP